MLRVITSLLLLASAAHGKVYFQERFEKSWEKRWVEPTAWKPASELGKWKHTAGKWYGSKIDKGIQTSKDARHHGISAALTEVFDNKGKDLIIQYSVKHEQQIDCGGAYIKLLPPGIDQDGFGGDTKYNVMFGPDICGHSTRKSHVIFNYKGENLLTKNEPRCEVDQLSHVYTLIVRPDNTYEVQIDGEMEKAGSLEQDWDFLKPAQIQDPDASKPTDWVSERMIPDPTDKKPDGYDDISEMIPDPDAEKPEDWDDEDDGEWEPPLLDNPEYMGPYEPKMIANPEYKGEWVHPMTENPAYEADSSLYHRCDPCGSIGFELWQVKAGTLFDDIIVTDSLEEARAFMAETHGKKAEKEKDMFEEFMEAKREEEEQARKAAEEARRAAEEDADEEEEEVDVDEDEGEGEDEDENAELKSEL